MTYTKWRASWVCKECGEYHWGGGGNVKFFRPVLCNECGSTSRNFKYVIWRWISKPNPNKHWYNPFSWPSIMTKEMK